MGWLELNNFKKAIMKKIFSFLILSLLAVSCYNDYIKDFNYDGVYFTYQVDVRTLVVGEDMKINFGVELAGVLQNKRDRIVQYQIDNSLLTPSTLTQMKNGASYIKTAMAPVSALQLLPASYYTLSDNSKFVIKAGQYSGAITLKPDSTAFLTDASTLIPNYALPLRITKADADTIVQTKNYEVIAFKYENMLFGNYWHGGVTIVKNLGGVPIDTIYYYTTIPVVETKIWTLKTVSPNSLVANGYSDQTTAKNEMTLTLNGTNITVSSAVGSTFTVIPDGASTFNRAKLLQDRKIVLSYKYINASGNTCYAQDTLTFRNRIRDGINEWQDENPSHY
jgi:hypothetical protein